MLLLLFAFLLLFRVNVSKKPVDKREDYINLIVSHDEFKSEEKFLKWILNEYGEGVLSKLNKFLKGLFKFKEINNIEDIVYFSNIKSIDDNEIVCKIKEKEIFVFIRVIENLDNNITFKIFEKSINIIKRWKNENQKSNKRYPIVIPIVLYIGKNKWKQRKVNNKLKYIICEKNKINFSYNIIDINDLKFENLEKLESKVIKEIIKIKKAN